MGKKGLEDEIRELEEKWLISIPADPDKRAEILRLFEITQEEANELFPTEDGLLHRVIAALQKRGGSPHQQRFEDVYRQFNSRASASEELPEVSYIAEKKDKRSGTVSIDGIETRIWVDDDLVKEGGAEYHFNGFMEIFKAYRQDVIDKKTTVGGSRYSGDDDQPSYKLRMRDVYKNGEFQHTIITAKKKYKRKAKTDLENNDERQFYVKDRKTAQQLFRSLGLTRKYGGKTKEQTFYHLNGIKCEIITVPELHGTKYLEIETEQPGKKKNKARDGLYKIAKELGIDDPSKTVGEGGLRVTDGYNSLLGRLKYIQHTPTSEQKSN